ncbi:flagellar hook-length control protein FliK [Alkalihalobacterium chitinilyticum]|uniref:Flagellar hook-length control protein FliK n=1 Tax=Alkalihalobacterium chitinilyticum TaxID=2980103 RepID=A0ABT5VES9_9BACI|nr:flagellar hook-length control protein FliK [Alkalihalobacterium chitinilyticum]MDE5412963.1 flagellar hook-length control protein FliK [Alkalihalobacterium chitinilyticum]
MNIAGVIGPSQSNTGNGPATSKNLSSSNSTFSKLLSSSFSGETSAGTGLRTTENVADKERVNDEQLLSLIKELVEALPFEDGFLTEEKLDDSDVQQLLALLPEELQLEIEKIFQSKLPIEALLQSGDTLNNPAAMLTFLVALKRSLSDPHTSAQTKDINQFMKHLEQLLKVGDSVNTLDVKDPKDIMRQLIQALQKEDQRINQNQILQSLMQRIGVGERSTEGQQGININTDGQNMSRVQQLVVHIGEQPTKEAEQRQFVRQFQEILGRGVLKNLNNGSQLSIKLFPQHLGRLDIQLSQINGVITARILASTSTARELIESQIQQLRQAFSQQQLNVERIEVTQQQQQSAGNLNKDGQGRQAERDQDEQQSEDNERENESFSQLLEEITINEKV